MKRPTQGTLLQILNGGYVTVAQRLKLEGPGLELEIWEKTSNSSTRKTKAAALVDLGSFSGTLWYDPLDASHQLLPTKLLAATAQTWKLIYPAGIAHVRFTAFVSRFKPTGMEIKGFHQAEFELALDGLTYDFGSGPGPGYIPPGGAGWATPDYFPRAWFGNVIS